MSQFLIAIAGILVIGAAVAFRDRARLLAWLLDPPPRPHPLGGPHRAAQARADWGAGYEQVPPGRPAPWQPAAVKATAGGPPWEPAPPVWAAVGFPRDTGAGHATGAGELPAGLIQLPRLGAAVGGAYTADGTCLERWHQDSPDAPREYDTGPAEWDGPTLAALAGGPTWLDEQQERLAATSAPAITPALIETWGREQRAAVSRWHHELEER